MNFSYNVYFIPSLGALCFAGCYFLYNQELIVFRFSKKNYVQNIKTTTASKKIVTRKFWHHERWQQEDTELVWPENKSEAIHYLINSWLSLLDEEQIMPKKVTVQSVALSPNQQEAYISFDRNPFSKESSTFEKLMWVEGLLKTLYENEVSIQHVRFLVHHQPMHDYHLDFSNSWPIIGFLEQKSPI